MKKTLIVILVTALVAVSASILRADDHLDDAYYWDGPTHRTLSKTVQTGSTKKQQPVQTSTPQKVEKVSIISANDTVVKAVIRR